MLQRMDVYSCISKRTIILNIKYNLIAMECVNENPKAEVQIFVQTTHRYDAGVCKASPAQALPSNPQERGLHLLRETFLMRF